MSVDQIRKSLSNVEETAVEKARKALERANRSEEIRKEKATKAIKNRIRKLDHGLWKLVHEYKDHFYDMLNVGKDICRIG